MLDDFNELSIDFNFILKFKLLRRFETNQRSQNAIGLAIDAFSKLKYLQHFKCKHGNKHFEIYTMNGENEKRYFLYCYLNEDGNQQVLVKKIFDLKGLINYLYDVKD